MELITGCVIFGLLSALWFFYKFHKIVQNDDLTRSREWERVLRLCRNETAMLFVVVLVGALSLDRLDVLTPVLAVLAIAAALLWRFAHQYGKKAAEEEYDLFAFASSVAQRDDDEEEHQIVGGLKEWAASRTS